MIAADTGALIQALRGRDPLARRRKRRDRGGHSPEIGLLNATRLAIGAYRMNKRSLLER
jgi:hypothetical protein